MAHTSQKDGSKPYVYRRSASVAAAALPRSTAEFYAMRQRPIALDSDPAVKRYLENKGAEEKKYEPVGTGTRKATLTGKNKASKKLRVNVLVGVILLVLVAAVVVVALRTDFTTMSPINLNMAPTPTATNEETDEAAAEAFAGTVLPRSGDAGASYVADTLFLGDSNTARLGTFGDVTGLALNNCIGIEGMSVEGAMNYSDIQFEGMYGTYTMVEALPVLQPRRIVIAFGTNNVGAGQSVEVFVEAYSEVLDAMNAVWPYADVIIASVPPIDMYCTYANLDMVTINTYNTELEELAETKGCKFLNWTETLMDEGTGYMRDGFAEPDGLHITQDAAAAMMYYVRTHSYVADDRRPASQETIPQRLPLASPVTGLSETTNQSNTYPTYDYSAQGGMAVDPENTTGMPDLSTDDDAAGTGGADG